MSQTLQIEQLTVLYDADCGFCVRCARWLLQQRAHVKVRCLPHDSPTIALMFPTLRKLAKADLTVIDDRTGVYRGSNAWIMCLWALEEWRPWAFRFASPALAPLAREAFEVVSSNRGFLNGLLGLRNDDAVARQLRAAVDPASHIRCDANCHPG